MIGLIAWGLLFAGSVLKGILGIGLPMVSIPLLTLAVGLPRALAIVVIPVALANLWQVWQFRANLRSVPSLWPFLATGAIGAAAGSWTLSLARPELLEVGLGGIVVIYLGMRAFRELPVLPAAAGLRLAPFAGVIAGLLHGMTGISGPVGVTFFHALKLPRPEFILCTGMMFLMFTVGQLPVLVGTAILRGPDALIGLAGLPAVALGLTLGNRIAGRVNPALFDRLVLGILGFTGVTLLWRALPEVF